MYCLKLLSILAEKEVGAFVRKLLVSLPALHRKNHTSELIVDDHRYFLQHYPKTLTIQPKDVSKFRSYNEKTSKNFFTLLEHGMSLGLEVEAIELLFNKYEKNL
jgi:hypothetical protein